MRQSETATWISMGSKGLIIGALALILSACMYRVGIRQGDLMSQEDLAKIEIEMTKAEVSFILGEPFAYNYQIDAWYYIFSTESIEQAYQRLDDIKEVLLPEILLVFRFENDRLIMMEEANIEYKTRLKKH